MTDESFMFWTGASGKKYKYYKYLIGTSMKNIPANYIFAKSTTSGYWTPVYIGESEDINTRLDSHHKEECIIKNGATHIFTHISSSDLQERLDEETDLRDRFNTQCNDQ